jgi:hypothetical protein
MYSLPWPKGKPGENKGVRGFDEPNANAINKMAMYGRRLGRPNGDVILINVLILE